MNPKQISDVGTTAIGGGAGLQILYTVKWEAMQYGEYVKVFVAMVLIIFSYLAYRDRNPHDGAAA